MGGEVNVAHLSGKDPGSDMGEHDSRYRDKGEPPRVDARDAHPTLAVKTKTPLVDSGTIRTGDFYATSCSPSRRIGRGSSCFWRDRTCIGAGTHRTAGLILSRSIQASLRKLSPTKENEMPAYRMQWHGLAQVIPSPVFPAKRLKQPLTKAVKEVISNRISPARFGTASRLPKNR